MNSPPDPYRGVREYNRFPELVFLDITKEMRDYLVVLKNMDAVAPSIFEVLSLILTYISNKHYRTAMLEDMTNDIVAAYENTLGKENMAKLLEVIQPLSEEIMSQFDQFGLYDARGASWYKFYGISGTGITLKRMELEEE